MMQHFMLLQRNLVYTAVTRGRKMVVLVGEWRALAMAVKNNHIRRRWTWLAHRLAGEDGAVNTRMLPDVNAARKRRAKKAEAVPNAMPNIVEDAHPAESALFEDME